MIYLLLVSLFTYADLQSLYGVGSSSTALSGANRNIPYEASSSLYNPAMQNLYPQSQFNVGYIYAYDDFKNLNNIVVENEFIGGSNTNNTSDVDTSVDDTNNMFLSTVYVFEKNNHKRSVGFHLSLPTDKIIGVETQSPYYPQYAMYFADTQRITLNAALAWSVTENLHLGLGFYFYMTTGSTVRTTLPASDMANPRTSSVDIKLEVKPSIAPVFGMIYSIRPSHYLGFNYMGERDAEMAFDAKNNVNVLSANPIPVNFEGSSSLYYDPEVFSFGYSYQGEVWDIHAAFDYERWSAFQGSSVTMNFDSNTSFEQFLETSDYKDIISPKLGLVFKTSKSKYLLGLGFRPSPVPDPKGNMNYLDSDRLQLGLGFSRQFETIPFFPDLASELALHFQGHSLKAKKVVKTGTDIGSPGYDIGGAVYSFGFSWNIYL